MISSAYSATIQGFLSQSPAAIVASMTRRSQSVILDKTPSRYQREWEERISLLQNSLKPLDACQGWEDWFIFLENTLPWGVMLIDSLILAGDLLIPVHFNLTASDHDSGEIAAINEASWRYAKYHPLMRGHLVVPVLCCPQAPPRSAPHCYLDSQVQATFLTNAMTLAATIGYIVESYGHRNTPLDGEKWEKAKVRVVPNFREGIKSILAYRVLDLPHLGHWSNEPPFESCYQWLENLDFSKHNRHYCIVQGAPASGKTFLALDLACSAGNGLYLHPKEENVRLIRHLGAEVECPSHPLPMKIEESFLASRVQELYEFLNRHYGPDIAPEVQLVCVDDAQLQMQEAAFHRKYLHYRNEAQMLTSIFERHTEIPVVVLVFLTFDQAFHEPLRPEASAWLKIIPDLEKRGWQIHLPGCWAHLTTQHGSSPTQAEHLSLTKNLRSSSPYETEDFNIYIREILSGKYNSSNPPPHRREGHLYLTRSLEKARQWIREHRKEHELAAILHSSHAARLIPSGLPGGKQKNLRRWYLTPPSEHGASSRLEHPGTETRTISLE
ncbi:MAG: DUF2075 domain-containing protein, partial [Lentisphaerae bacterium]